MRCLAREERADLAAFLATLPPQRWQAPTLCAGWRVRDVVAHVISYDELGARELAAIAVRCLLRLSLVNAVTLARYDSCAPEQLLELLAGHLQPRGRACGARRPGRAGRGTDPPSGHPALARPAAPCAAGTAATRAAPALIAPDIGGLWHIRGVRLVATDLRFAAGAGAEVRGPAEALLMAIAGLPGVTGELSGPGQRKLADCIGG